MKKAIIIIIAVAVGMIAGGVGTQKATENKYQSQIDGLKTELTKCQNANNFWSNRAKLWHDVSAVYKKRAWLLLQDVPYKQDYKWTDIESHYYKLPKITDYKKTNY